MHQSTLTLPSFSSLGLRASTVVAFALLTALAAQVQVHIPGNVVPITMQTAVVLLAGLRLGSRDGSLSQAAYLVAGALGLPLFAGAAGVATLFGPTGGYLVGFVLAAWLLGRARSFATSFARTWILTFAASFVIFAAGLIQLKTFFALSWGEAFMMGVVPFILGDLVKVTLTTVAYRLSLKVWR